MCIKLKMKKNSTPTYIDTKTLNVLKNQPNTSIEVEKQNYHLALHPFHLTNLKGSVKDILSNEIARYNKKLKGILMGYQNVQITSASAPINYDNCFLHVDIVAEFFLFKPKLGDTLNGVVNKKSDNHIGCLVHKTFNVSLPKPEDETDWIGSKAQVGHDVVIEISLINLENRLPYIKGILKSILNEDSGISTSEECSSVSSKKNKITKFDEPNEELGEKRKKSKKNKKSKKEESEINIVETLIEEDVTNMKSKKKKHKEDEHEDVLNTENENTIKSKKKKKHKKETNDTGLNHEEIQEIADLKRKKRKKHKEDMENSLEDLNLGIIFNNIDFKVHEDIKPNIKEVKTEPIDISEAESKPKKHKKNKKQKKDPSDEASLNEIKMEQDFSFLGSENDVLDSSINIQSEKDNIDNSINLNQFLNDGKKHKKHKKDKYKEEVLTDVEAVKKRKRRTLYSDTLNEVVDFGEKKQKIRRHSLHEDTGGKQKIHLLESIIVKPKDN